MRKATACQHSFIAICADSLPVGMVIKMKIRTKRLFSSLLALMMVVNMIPPPMAYAVEEADTGSNVETVLPAEPSTEEPSAPTTEPDPPTEEPSAPTTEPDPPTEEPAEPTTEPDTPTEEPSAPTTEPDTPPAESDTPATEPATPEEPDGSGKVQSLINDLPEAETITEGNADNVKAQLDEIDTAMAKLSDDELDKLDTTRYESIRTALLALEGNEGANQPQTLEAHAEKQDGDVASVTIDGNTQYYVTLNEAWEAAKGHTAEINLLESVNLDNESNKTLTDGSATVSNITMKMEDGVTLSGSSSQLIQINTYGATWDATEFSSFTLESGTIINNSTSSASAISCYGTTVNITGGSIQNDNGYAIEARGFSKVNISNGSIKGKYGLYLALTDDGSANISGGTFTGNNGLRISYSNEGQISLTGGTFNGSEHSISYGDGETPKPLKDWLASGYEYRQNGKQVADNLTELNGEVSVVETRINIGTQPEDQTLCYADTTTTKQLSVTAAPVQNTDTLKYQWYKAAAADGSDGQPIEGETGTEYTLPNNLNVGDYYYYCKVSVDGGPAESALDSRVAKVTVTQSGTAVSASIDKSECTYGDTVNVTATANPTGTAPAMLMASDSFTERESGQMAVYYNDTQVSEAVSADVNGSYKMSVNTADVVAAGAGTGEAVDLSVKFKATESMADALATVSVTINPKVIEVTGETLGEKTYDGEAEGTVTGVTFSGLISGESLVKDTDYTASAVYLDVNAGTDKTANVTIELTTNKYTFANGAKTTTYTLENQTIERLDVEAYVELTAYRYEYLGPGTPIEPEITVTVEGSELSSDDYSVAYSNNDRPGLATLTVSNSEKYTAINEQI